ncbi:MAG: hypothetical protein RLY70_2891, partial [Planctomycetota bacterium]
MRSRSFWMAKPLSRFVEADRSLRLASFAAAAFFFFSAAASELSAQSTTEFKPKLMIAYGAYHPRKQQPTIYLYQHDGESRGKVAGEVKSEPKRSDYHPSLSADGKLCAFAA